MYEVIPELGITPIFLILTLPLFAVAIFLLLNVPDADEGEA
jgi:hypothetical protein